MLKYPALAAIRFYQTILSPYKGFRCAYAACTGCASCSTLGYRAIRRYGVIKGLEVLRWRFEECGVAHRNARQTRPRALGQQRGDCDCGGCDGDISLDFLDCCSGGDDRKQRRRKNQPQR